MRADRAFEPVGSSTDDPAAPVTRFALVETARPEVRSSPTGRWRDDDKHPAFAQRVKLAEFSRRELAALIADGADALAWQPNPLTA